MLKLSAIMIERLMATFRLSYSKQDKRTNLKAVPSSHLSADNHPLSYRAIYRIMDTQKGEMKGKQGRSMENVTL